EPGAPDAADPGVGVGRLPHGGPVGGELFRGGSHGSSRGGGAPDPAGDRRARGGGTGDRLRPRGDSPGGVALPAGGGGRAQNDRRGEPVPRRGVGRGTGTSL